MLRIKSMVALLVASDETSKPVAPAIQTNLSHPRWKILSATGKEAFVQNLSGIDAKFFTQTLATVVNLVRQTKMRDGFLSV